MKSVHLLQDREARRKGSWIIDPNLWDPKLWTQTHRTLLI